MHNLAGMGLVFTPVVVIVAIFLLFRVLWLWYWRVNHAIARFDRMIELMQLQNRQLGELVLLGQGRSLPARRSVP